MEVNGQLHALVTLHQMKGPQVQTRQKAVSAPQPVWTLWQSLLPMLGIETQDLGHPAHS